MKKSKDNTIRGAEPEIPEAVMERLRQAFQAPAGVELSCPEPEQVIGCALEELDAAEDQKVRDHLLTCRDCLELFLDVRLAGAEAASTVAEKLALIPQDPQYAGWLAAFGSKFRETLQVLVKPRKLIPALAAVSLVILVAVLGREEKSRMLPPPPHFALERSAGPTAAPGAAPPQASADAKPSLTFPEPRLRESQPQAKTAAPVLERFAASKGALPDTGSIRLELTEDQNPAGGIRLSYRVDRDAFAYLLWEESGKIRLLFSGNLKGGQTSFYPAQNQQLKSDSPTGQVMVYLIAAGRPVSDLKTRIQELEERGTLHIQSLFPGSTIQSLAVKLP